MQLVTDNGSNHVLTGSKCFGFMYIVCNLLLEEIEIVSKVKKIIQ